MVGEFFNGTWIHLGSNPPDRIRIIVVETPELNLYLPLLPGRGWTQYIYVIYSQKHIYQSLGSTLVFGDVCVYTCIFMIICYPVWWHPLGYQSWSSIYLDVEDIWSISPSFFMSPKVSKHDHLLGLDILNIAKKHSKYMDYNLIAIGLMGHGIFYSN